MQEKSYFTLNEITEKKLIGAYEQIQELLIPLNKYLLDEFQNLNLERDKFSEKLPALDKFKTSEEALLTDILSCKFITNNVGIIISDKFSNMIKSLNLIGVKIHKSIVNHLNINYSYNFLEVIEDSGSISYNKSTFQEEDLLGMETGNLINISSFLDFQRKDYLIQKNNPGNVLVAKTIYLNDKYDLFRLPGSPLIHVSDKFKTLVEKNKFTGFNFKKSDIPIHFA